MARSRLALLLILALGVFASVVVLTSASAQSPGPGCGTLSLNGKTYSVCELLPTPTPIPQLPRVITEPGTYRGHSANPSGTCVEVRVSNVIIEDATIGPCAGRGVYVHDVSNFTLRNSYVSTGTKPAACCDSADGVFASRVNTLRIEGSTLERSETNIEALGSTNITITGNTLRDPLGPYPRGQQIQVWPIGVGEKPAYVTIADNKMSCDVAKGCNQEDAVSLSITSGTVSGNSMIGGVSGSGCGLILEGNTTHVTVKNNYAEGQQCGFGMAGGSDNRFESNTVRLHSNVAFYAAPYNGPCTRITFAGNTAGPRADGLLNTIYVDPRCTETVWR
jgi:hypothetical protein